MPTKLRVALSLLLPLLLANAARILLSSTSPPLAPPTPHASPRLSLHLEEVLMDVHDTPHYGLNGSAADAQWAALIPHNGGIVRLRAGTREKEETFMLGMAHQLRCLDVIRRDWVRGAELHEADAEWQPTTSAVTAHCLAYLRQMVLCHADRRLEPVVDPFGAHAVNVRGVQTCRDWEAVYKWVLGHEGEYDSDFSE
ncbi:hypothetical protein FB451DRAFT_1372967 [Mycena latifolia]|nr:hypothetical protein FB451DRAFT_1372967 [Mycena latifolia]